MSRERATSIRLTHGFRPIVASSADLLLRPIVPPPIQCKGWQSQFLRHRRIKRIMNSVDKFETIVGEHYEALFRFAISLTRTESDAWDLTQQTFYVWATKGHQLRDISKVKTWLFTALHRAFLASRRRQTRFPHHDLEEVSEELPVMSPDLADQMDSSQVLSALAKVDEVYQAAVALFYLQDRSYKDIALMLEVPIGTVKSRIARGIVQLREVLLSGGDRTSAPLSAVKQDWDSSPTLLREQVGAV
jgi:RNA polymerase sigma-70 factor, ECF subfamily